MTNFHLIDTIKHLQSRLIVAKCKFLQRSGIIYRMNQSLKKIGTFTVSLLNIAKKIHQVKENSLSLQQGKFCNDRFHEKVGIDELKHVDETTHLVNTIGHVAQPPLNLRAKTDARAKRYKFDSTAISIGCLLGDRKQK